MSLNDVNSLSHTKWNCKYHIHIYGMGGQFEGMGSFPGKMSPHR